MKNFLSVYFFLISFVLQAQYNNLFQNKDSLSYMPHSLSIGIKHLNYIKNNEYFNLIADGYTLIGSKTDAEIVLKPYHNYNFTAGFTFIKYAGIDTFTQTIPYLSLNIKKGNNNFYLGKLYTSDFHQLPQILYSNERILDKRYIENGLQHRFTNTNWSTDTWLEWEYFIFKKDSLRERLNFGHTTNYTYFFKNGSIKIPFQLYLHHRGGQINQSVINTQNNNTITVSNIGMGVSLERSFFSKNRIGFTYQYFMHHINTNQAEEFIFKSGKAHWGQLFFIRKNIFASINYWKSDKFVSVKGDDMFQSVSRRVEKFTDSNNQTINVFEAHTEPNRELIYMQFRFKKEIYQNLFVGFSSEFFYQLNKSNINSPVYNATVHHQLDYNTELFLIFTFQHKLFAL